jgi:hypothetical protein
MGCGVVASHIDDADYRRHRVCDHDNDERLGTQVDGHSDEQRRRRRVRGSFRVFLSEFSATCGDLCRVTRRS